VQNVADSNKMNMTGLK